MKMRIYDIIRETTNLFLNTLSEEERVVAIGVIKKYRWYFFCKWPAINNIKVEIGSDKNGDTSRL